MSSDPLLVKSGKLSASLGISSLKMHLAMERSEKRDLEYMKD